jgi:hypothetical protein
MHRYLINEWKSDRHIAPIYNTERESDFRRAVKETIKKYAINGNSCRMVERPNITVFSFADSPSVRSVWLFTEMAQKPITEEYGIPRWAQ